MSYLDLDFKTQIEPLNSKPSKRARNLKLKLFFIFFIIICITIFTFFDSFSSENSEITVSKTQTIELTPPNQQSTKELIKTSQIEVNTKANNPIPKNIPLKELEQNVFDQIEKQNSIVIPPKQKINEPVSSQEESIPAITVVIKNGDSLSTIFNKQKLKPSVLHKIVSESEHGKLLKTIKSGQEFSFHLDSSGNLQTLIFKPDIIDSYIFTLNENNKYSSSFKTTPLDAVPTYREGIISSSLFLAAEKSNIPVNVIMNLVAIFAWDIDFALDIRKGDSFRLIYNELFQDGENIKTGKILAAEFINRGKVYRAFNFTDPTGKSNYYSPSGKSMRKAFLRNPVEFSRISSRFTNKRWHPVLSKWRSHKGVDYAAPRGTPIYAAGDGKIIHKGNKGGYGRTIVLEHGGKYTTLYAHLNSYNKKMRNGKRVKQGQTIGYVGSSGLATGPHLHYEFRVSGVHRNPLTVKLPAAQPINKKYKDEFNKVKDQLLNMLNLMDNDSGG